jgi:hypothetical protein
VIAYSGTREIPGNWPGSLLSIRIATDPTVDSKAIVITQARFEWTEHASIDDHDVGRPDRDARPTRHDRATECLRSGRTLRPTVDHVQ